MGELKGSQRKYLRGLAHSYKPLVQIGKEGLSESVIRAIDTALEARLNCECVGTVGRTAILYREHPDPEKRKITVPQ